MPIQATVILDSGCFLKQPDDNIGKYTEIGYFGSSNTVSDIRIIADGREEVNAAPMNLEKNCVIEVRHVKATGEVNRSGLSKSDRFRDEILHMEDLYGEPVSVDRSKFDCIIRFESGHFCGALVKPRAFKEHKKQPNGKFAHSPEDKPKLLKKAIAHNIHVHFRLRKGETLELLRDGKTFWTSYDSGAKERIEVEIVADNDTAEKFFRLALKGKRDSYWLPNQGDPPPICPEPPCQP